MKRRLLLAAPLLLASCGLSERPYSERRQWPLAVRRPDAPRRAQRSGILLVRSLRAGPGLEARGLQMLQADGSIHSEFYEEWLVPPADAVEDSLRTWLSESGLFAGVVAAGSRLQADFVLEGELTTLLSAPAAHEARAALGITVIRQRPVGSAIVLQRRFTETAGIEGDGAAASVLAQTRALAAAFTAIEAALAAVG
jgi:ABC-type uncharacterized transport system auxiliary subunit